MRTFESIVPYSTGTIPSFTVQIILCRYGNVNLWNYNALLQKVLYLMYVRRVPFVHLLYIFLEILFCIETTYVLLYYKVPDR